MPAITVPLDEAGVTPAAEEKVYDVAWFHNIKISVTPVPNSPGQYAGEVSALRGRMSAEDMSLHPNRLDSFSFSGEFLQEAIGGLTPACPDAATMMGPVAFGLEQLYQFWLTKQTPTP